MREKLYLNHVVPERQITNKVNKERDKPNHRAQETRHSVKLMYSLLEGKRRQPDKIKFQFLNRPKQTELAKHIHVKLRGVNLTAETMLTNMCDLCHDICYTTGLLFLKLFQRTQHIMPFRTNNAKQNGLEGQN